MNDKSEALAQRKIAELARRYAEQGHEVIVQPQKEQLPAFLADFSPDLIVRGPRGNFVVEVKSTMSAKNDRTAEHLARAVAAQPGWQFRYVLAGADDPEWQPPTALPMARALEAGLHEVDTLMKAGASRAAVVMLWSAIEGLLRHHLAKRGFDPTERFSSGALLKQAVSEGYLDDAEYKRLRILLSARNTMAHGFLDESLPGPDFAAAREIASRLLESLTEAA
jgi:hypothetical protein